MFQPDRLRLVLEEEERDGALVVTPAVKVVRYMTSGSSMGIGIPGQPVPQTYFHRPLHVLFEPFFRSGFVLDGLEETAFTDPSNARGPLSWDHYPEIPPVLVVRLCSAS